MSTVTTEAAGDTQRGFRHAMAHLSAAVNVLTTEGEDGPRGITVSAVCSVTDSPPTVLVCVNQSSSSHEAFRSSERVGINVLGGTQTEVARDFAGMTRLPMADRFAAHDWTHEHGAPLLDDAVVAVTGTVRDTVQRGTHTVFFVEVDHVEVRPEADGLVYFGRQFHRLGTAEQLQVAT
ncbi:4-hydroxyphenylacetate 3-monooxygenase reductase subunit [Kineococcus sp. R8]|uniref:flavin reductase n=1 Tax=Kineococcus siccus TaxID=2696567 RepID=UPI00141375A2|nr:flavin reductase [Kineococcus siccus]NAZ80406.1 4-hydroxyphenylacetate 3-monooxygenase reductase subunit [Kineococcus siccus]